MGSQREPIRDPDEAGVVPFDVVHLCDLRRGVSEQVRDLFRREAEERSVRLLDSVYKFRTKCMPEAKIDRLIGGETLASHALTAALWEVFCLEAPLLCVSILACQIARMGLSGRPFPSVRLTVSIWSFSGFQYGLANDEGVLGIIFIVFETTERIPFRFKVFLLIPLTNRVSSHIIG